MWLNQIAPNTRKECRNHSENLTNRTGSKFYIEATPKKNSQLRQNIFFDIKKNPTFFGKNHYFLKKWQFFQSFEKIQKFEKHKINFSQKSEEKI